MPAGVRRDPVTREGAHPIARSIALQVQATKKEVRVRIIASRGPFCPRHGLLVITSYPACVSQCEPAGSA